MILIGLFQLLPRHQPQTRQATRPQGALATACKPFSLPERVIIILPLGSPGCHAHPRIGPDERFGAQSGVVPSRPLAADIRACHSSPVSFLFHSIPSQIRKTAIIPSQFNHPPSHTTPSPSGRACNLLFTPSSPAALVLTTYDPPPRYAYFFPSDCRFSDFLQTAR